MADWSSSQGLLVGYRAVLSVARPGGVSNDIVLKHIGVYGQEVPIVGGFCIRIFYESAVIYVEVEIASTFAEAKNSPIDSVSSKFAAFHHCLICGFFNLKKLESFIVIEAAISKSQMTYVPQVHNSVGAFPYLGIDHFNLATVNEL